MEASSKTWEEKLDLVLETSYGIIGEEDGVLVSIEVSIGNGKNPDYGYFEVYDVDSGGEEWYASGGLWFKGNEMVDYDGVFDLIQPIKDHLKSLGVTGDILD